jgi:hypothetical protein
MTNDDSRRVGGLELKSKDIQRRSTSTKQPHFCTCPSKKCGRGRGVSEVGCFCEATQDRQLTSLRWPGYSLARLRQASTSASFHLTLLISTLIGAGNLPSETYLYIEERHRPVMVETSTKRSRRCASSAGSGCLSSESSDETALRDSRPTSTRFTRRLPKRHGEARSHVEIKVAGFDHFCGYFLHMSRPRIHISTLRLGR